ncbi:PI-PLC domain-containing protein [Pontibacter beigongshangensis]|uniref:hypothetical protein n=1 Tax=Pontibacter beigongshangensis TaxID=2574733 RepID=UPI0016502686|nr:hypothetical protein [Pontibacter beigongshangensis]
MLDHYARVAYLKGDVPPANLAQGKFYGLDYHVSLFLKYPEWVEQARQLKISLNYWTGNDPVQIDALLAESVDFITTDEPEILLEKISRQAAA